MLFKHSEAIQMCFYVQGRSLPCSFVLEYVFSLKYNEMIDLV